MPGGQRVGADEPTGQKAKSGHSSGWAVPLDAHRLPAGQLAQRSCPSVEVSVPGVQGVGEMDPISHALPAGHGWQLVCVLFGWNSPPLQGSHVHFDTSPYEPGAHSVGVTEPVGHALPGVQALQAVCTV